MGTLESVGLGVVCFWLGRFNTSFLDDPLGGIPGRNVHAKASAGDAAGT